MYRYEDLKQDLFTDNGQKMFIQIRDNAKRLLKTSGAFKMGNVISVATGDSWKMLACVDRMVELGELREITMGMKVAGQDRVFVEA